MKYLYLHFADIVHDGDDMRNTYVENKSKKKCLLKTCQNKP